VKRRAFVAAAGSAFVASACASSAVPPPGAFKAVPLTRLEVNAFANDARSVAALRKAVAAMMAIADDTDERSWNYWHYSHWMPNGMTPPPSMARVWNQCRHGEPYFYAWHRGYVRYFELMLQAMSGDPTLMLPYWDYYANPSMPAIFSDPTLSDGSPNPLYWSNRQSATVTGLIYASFLPRFTTFQSADPDAPTFELISEINPHGAVHDAIGGDMGTVPTAAADPVFWVHHCNVDRLWSAWVAAGAGRSMPPAGDPYYEQSFTYDLVGKWTVSLPQLLDTAGLGYVWDNVSLPAIPPGADLPAEPAVRHRSRASGSSGALDLDITGASVTIPLSAPVSGSSTVTLTLDGVQLTAAGAKGGYNFNLYVNLPPAATAETLEAEYFVGTIGAFAVSVEAMMSGGPIDLRFELQNALALQGGSFDALTISFVGTGAIAAGQPLVTIGGLSIQ